MLGSIELNETTLLGKTSNEQFKLLNRYITKYFKVDYVSVFIATSDSYKFLEGSSKITDTFVNTLNIENPQIKFNKDGLLDSKDRGISARFSIPLKIKGIYYLVIIESKKLNALKDKEKEVFKIV